MGNRVRQHLFEGAIDAGTRDRPHTRNARPSHNSEHWRARASGSSSRPPVGQRAFALRRRDLGVEQFVVHGRCHPPLDFVASRAISSSRSCALASSFKAVAAPTSAQSRHSVSLAMETLVSRSTQVQRLAAQQSRDDRDLALNGKALRTIPLDARRGTYASFGGALRRPFGLAPFITRHV